MRRIVLFFGIFWAVCSFSNVRLMLVGDSITRGVKSGDDLGFRNDFYDSLKSRAYPVDWVGIFGASPLQGHFKAGARISDMYPGPGGNNSLDAASSLDPFRPHVVMVHLGSNDVFSQDEIAPYSLDGGRTFQAETVSGRMAVFLSYLLQWKYGPRGGELRYLFVSKIIPRLDCGDRVSIFNGELERIFQDSEAGRIPAIPAGSLKLFDQYASFDPARMLDPDGIHPNDAGYAHMAGIFFNAFQTLPMKLEKISGDGQDTGVDCELPEPLEVRMLNGSGEGVAGVRVRIEVVSGSASPVGSAQANTDSSGLAKLKLKMGGKGEAELRVSGDDLFGSAVFFTATAGIFARIQGVVTTAAQSAPVPRVRIEWAEKGTCIDSTLADGRFNSRTPLGESVTLRPVKDRFSDMPENAILEGDAEIVTRSLAGLKPLSSGGQRAADVNGDGKITAFDAFQIARYAAGFHPPDSVRIGEWIFLPDSRTYQPILGNWNGQNFSGILIGDVGGN
jgi:lysophospholipase L1-like esterase